MTPNLLEVATNLIFRNIHHFAKATTLNPTEFVHVLSEIPQLLEDFR